VQRLALLCFTAVARRGYFFDMGVLRNVVWRFEPDRPAKCHPNATRVALSPYQRPVLIPGGY
jgi:hypothetical protein